MDELWTIVQDNNLALVKKLLDGGEYDLKEVIEETGYTILQTV